MYSARPHEEALVECLHDSLDLEGHVCASAPPTTGDDIRTASDSVREPIVADAGHGGVGAFDRDEPIGVGRRDVCRSICLCVGRVHVVSRVYRDRQIRFFGQIPESSYYRPSG